jgi:hypothetical protein
MNLGDYPGEDLEMHETPSPRLALGYAKGPHLLSASWPSASLLEARSEEWGPFANLLYANSSGGTSSFRYCLKACLLLDFM